jgi:hypothetical protein
MMEKLIKMEPYMTFFKRGYLGVLAMPSCYSIRPEAFF